ncbi:MAG: hypothetical protein ACRD5H_01945 [Nitrososphaerales archaeon]
MPKAGSKYYKMENTGTQTKIERTYGMKPKFAAGTKAMKKPRAGKKVKLPKY